MADTYRNSNVTDMLRLMMIFNVLLVVVIEKWWVLFGLVVVQPIALKVLKLDRGAEKVLNVASVFLKNQLSDRVVFAV